MATITRNSRIQVLYSNTDGVTPDDGQLYNGEFAWAYGLDGDLKELYIGGGDSADVTFVGAEILRHSDDPFNPEPSDDNKLATTKAIYEFVDGQLGQKAGVVTIAGANGNVTVNGNDGITIDSTPTTGGGFTVGIEDGGIANSKLANDSIELLAGGGISLTTTNIQLGGQAQISVGVDDSTIQTYDAGGGGGNKIRVKEGGIDTAQLADDAVTNIKILDDTITNAKLANDGFNVSDQSTTIPISLGETLTLSGTDNEVTVVASNNLFNIGLPSDVIITNDLSVGSTLEVGGNLIVSGNLTTLDVTRVEVEDPIIFLGATSSGPPTARDIGFIAKFDNASYSGLIRDKDKGGGVYYLFDTDNDYSDITNFDSDDVTIQELRAHIVAGTFE